MMKLESSKTHKKMARQKVCNNQVSGQFIKLSALTKQQVLSIFVEKLVQKKIISTKKQSRLDHDNYKNMLLKIKSVGIDWRT